MIPFEDVIEEAFEKAKARKRMYAELLAEAMEEGWQAHTRPVVLEALQLNQPQRFGRI